MDLLTLAQNKLTLLNAKLVVAQQEGEEQVVMNLTEQIQNIQNNINELQQGEE